MPFNEPIFITNMCFIFCVLSIWIGFLLKPNAWIVSYDVRKRIYIFLSIIRDWQSLAFSVNQGFKIFIDIFTCFEFITREDVLMKNLIFHYSPDECARWLRCGCNCPMTFHSLPISRLPPPDQLYRPENLGGRIMSSISKRNASSHTGEHKSGIRILIWQFDLHSYKHIIMHEN